MIHELKSHPIPFRDVINGIKKYEIRVDDRDFRVGDVLMLLEWFPDLQKYSGATVSCGVLHKTPGGAWGLPPEICVLGIEVLPHDSLHPKWAYKAREV